MPSRKLRTQARPFGELVQILANKLRPPFGIILGSPGEVAELTQRLPEGETLCYQMDHFQAARLGEALRVRNFPPRPQGEGMEVRVDVRADLWDLETAVQTLIYPVPYGGERTLKLDMIEQAFHVLKPQGTLIVISPYDKDDFFPRALKKIFGRVHVPMEGANGVFWCQRDGERPRRRHEMTYHVRVDAQTSYSFVSRPGVFGYGFFDEGGRALTETMELEPGQRVLDLGCGVGTNGILANRQVGPGGFIAFADSNARAIALAGLNARALGLENFQSQATHTLTEWPDASFDVILANPPYYAQGTIMRLFVERGKALLRPEGVFYLVTKQVDIAWSIVQEHFPEPELFECRGYVIFRMRKT